MLHADYQATWRFGPCGRCVFHSLLQVCDFGILFALSISMIPGAAAQGQAAHSTLTGSGVPQARAGPRSIVLPVIDGMDIRFTQLSAAQGLSQARAGQIIQDDQGFLWFGTQYGLDRYDGYEFKPFVHDPARANSLSGSFIHSLFKDHSGAIWVGTDQGLDRFDRATESFTHFHLGNPEPIVFGISQDSSGMLWLATEVGLYRLDPANGDAARFGHNPTDSSSLSSDGIHYTGEDRSGKFWVITSPGLDAFDRAAGKVIQHVSLPELAQGSMCEAGCRSFHEDRFSVFWITGNGLYSFDRKSNQLTQYSLYEGKTSGTSLTAVNVMLEDRDGTMWFGTNVGLLKFDRAHREFIRYRRYPGDPGSLAENNVVALFEDREANIWVGFNAKAPDYFVKTQSAFEAFQPSIGDPSSSPGEDLVGAVYEDRQGTLWIGADGFLDRIDQKTGQYTRYNPGGAGGTSEVLSILEDQAGTMWVGTLGNGLNRFDWKTGRFQAYRHRPADPSSLSNDTVTRIFVDRAGSMWVNTADGLNQFNRTTGRFRVYKRNPNHTEPYFSIVEDQNGFLWLGTQAGLVQFRPSTGQFSVFQHRPEDASSLSDNTVDSIYQDRSGVLWLGTQDGLDKLDPKTLIFTTFYKKDGPPGNVVSCIIGDDSGHLWMSTNNGLSMFDPLTRTFENYSVVDGLPGDDLTGWDACYRSRTGKMFFGGFAGAVAFHPDKIVNSVFTVPVVFTDFQLSGRPVEIGPGSALKRSITYADGLTLSYKQDSFSLQFAGLSFRSPSANRYRYKLDGFDSEWHQVGSEQRVLSYTGLQAGVYELLVQGAVSRGPWSEPGTRLHIQILPPWWATWWFRTIGAALFMLIAFVLYSYRVQQIAHEFDLRLGERVSERTRIARELHDTLLQSFQGLMLRFQTVNEMLPTRPLEAKKALEGALDRADKALVEGRDAIQDMRTSTLVDHDLAQSMTALMTDLHEELATGNRDSVAFRVLVEGAPRTVHPALRDEIYRIARESLRNAFRHAQAGHIETEITYSEPLLRLRFRDDGKGIDPHVLEHGGRSGHWGLPGMRERANRIGGQLDVWSKPGAGTEVDLSIPGSIAYEEFPARAGSRLFRERKERNHENRS